MDDRPMQNEVTIDKGIILMLVRLLLNEIFYSFMVIRNTKHKKSRKKIEPTRNEKGRNRNGVQTTFEKCWLL